MIDVIEALMKGDRSYPRAFVAAKEFWDDFYKTHSAGSELQKAIDDAQLPFQWKLEKAAGLTAPFAKSIMALTAIGALYNDGFDDPQFAHAVMDAFMNSKSLSTGVIGAAKEVNQLYKSNWSA